MYKSEYDLAIIGGGINGCGIARDAAGRGLSVFLCEQDDLASGTSSASTKLIHGGLRYLEYYEFRLVREALREREVLLRSAPHIIWPLRFILPHHVGLRPAWLIRLGLFIYDHLGGRRLLPPTSTLDLRQGDEGRVLKADYRRGFEYSDCWVMDSRLVVLNAMDAVAKGAEINTQTKLLEAIRQGKTWHLQLRNQQTGEQREVRAKVLVNASGPWLDTLMPHISHQATRQHIRMVKGSHIVVRRLFDHEKAYIFQNKDGRIIFAIPYENDFTLIGTTDVDFHGDPGDVRISGEESRYLCDAASEYFHRTITVADIVSCFSGIRPLFDDGKSEAKAATRDYVLKLDSTNDEAPLLSIYGGKITTYRKLAETVLERLAPFLPPMGAPWTGGSHFPGGDFAVDGFTELVARLRKKCPSLDEQLATRLCRHYGTLALSMVDGIVDKAAFGQDFGHGLYGFEVDYLLAREFARSAADVLWRRSRLGLYFSQAETEALNNYIIARLDPFPTPGKN